MEYRDILDSLIESVKRIPFMHERIDAINDIKIKLHEISPFASEPVDCVLWVRSDAIQANDYNPNSVAPPEMELLTHSIMEDGYTQPIVAWRKEDGGPFEVVDGFHRNRVGKECPLVRSRIKGYLPLSIIKQEREGRGDRIASTIRHNRARGKHQIASMSEIVVELKRRNWDNKKISKELGMDEDEILRLCQITGLADLFSDEQFSKAWDVEKSISEDDFKELTDKPEDWDEDAADIRTVNTSDENRIFHTYEKWECYRAGFYNTTMPGKSRAECEEEYKNLLSSDDRFRAALDGVVSEWKNSCEHYLTNAAMNRIAWLGQAAMCYATGVPSTFRGGFGLLTEEQQARANNIALEYLNQWLKGNGREPLTLDEALSGRQSDIY
jgi:ParB-like chromosome segregation protein Spo0J